MDVPNSLRYPNVHQRGLVMQAVAHLDKVTALGNKKEQFILILITTWMDPTGIKLNERSQSQKVTHCIL